MLEKAVMCGVVQSRFQPHDNAARQLVYKPHRLPSPQGFLRSHEHWDRAYFGLCEPHFVLARVVGFCFVQLTFATVTGCGHSWENDSIKIFVQVKSANIRLIGIDSSIFHELLMISSEIKKRITKRT